MPSIFHCTEAKSHRRRDIHFLLPLWWCLIKINELLKIKAATHDHAFTSTLIISFLVRSNHLVHFRFLSILEGVNFMMNLFYAIKQC